MKHHFIVALCCAALAVTALAGEVAGRKMCWAHYVPWSPASINSFLPDKYFNAPFSDVTENVLSDEVAAAQAHGVDGFFMDVCAKVGNTAFADLTKFLRAAEGTDFQVGLCLDVKTSVTNQISELVKMLKLNGTHPNYPKWQGRYVVATYTWCAWSSEEWAQIRSGVEAAGFPLYLIANFDNGFNAFRAERIAQYAGQFQRGYSFMNPGCTGLCAEEMDTLNAAACRAAGATYMPTLWPGYYGAWHGGRNDFYQPYCGLDTLHDNFLGARQTFTDWLHVTTWNDHDETTLQARRLSPGCRELLRAYTDELKGTATNLPPRANFIIAYHRELFPGTLLRIEAMRLPSRETGSVKLAGCLSAADKIVHKLPPIEFSGPAWERHEWLIDTTSLAQYAELRPTFATRSVAGDLRADFPCIFFVLPNLSSPETVRATFTNIAPVESSLTLNHQQGVLTAAVNFNCERPVKRITLFADEQPIAQFAPTAAADVAPQLPLIIRGRGNLELRTKGCRITAPARQFLSRKDWFICNETSCRSFQQVEWEPIAMVLRGAGSAQLELVRNGKTRVFTLQELAAAARTEFEGVTICTGCDATVYTRCPFAGAAVTNAVTQLNLLCPAPPAHTRFWAQFECADGTCAESPIVHISPSTGLKTTRLLRTPINLDTKSGGSGNPGFREFLTPPSAMPVTNETLVTAKVDPRIFRTVHRTFKGEKSVRMPLRSWPSGAYKINYKFTAPAAEGFIIEHRSVQDGVGVRRLADGRVEVVRTSGPRNEGGAREVLTSRAILAPNTVHTIQIICRRDSLALAIDGIDDSSCPLRPTTRYGNSTTILYNPLALTITPIW